MMISVYEMLLQTTKKNPHRVAVKDDTNELTYEELFLGSSEMASKINYTITNKNSLILVISNRKVESIIAFWSVVISGNFYVAIDSKTPHHRMQEIVEKIEPKLILIMDENIEPYFYDKCPTIKVENYRTQDVNLVETIKMEKDKYIKKHIINTDPLYMVFTSGSTGTPKAIIKSHRSVLEFASSFVKEFSLDNKSYNDVLGNQASFDFDVSAKDIYISASIGATLCIIPNNCFTIPSLLAPYLSKNKISILIWAASAVKYVKRFDCFSKEVPYSIEKVFFSGESIQADIIRYWKSYLPSSTYINLYAPSEVTGNCLYHVVEEEITGNLPLDTVFSNIDVLCVNEKKNIVLNGEKGEFYVRGSFLSEGYYKDELETASKFIQNPLHNDYKDIVYKTGDYATLLDNKYYFNGRTDNQIKHMGHRIELEEIENHIYKNFELDYICIFYDEIKGKIILAVEDGQFTHRQLVLVLKNLLPKYMIPHEIIYTKIIPKNERGKVDRARMRDLYKEMNNERTII